MDATLIPTKFANVTKSDTVPVNAALGLYIGTGGDVTVKGADGVSAKFVAGAGSYLTGRFHMVMSTGTTASDIVALS